MDKTEVLLSCGEGFVLSAESEGRTKEVKVEAGDGASVAEKFVACSVHECENVH